VLILIYMSWCHLILDLCLPSEPGWTHGWLRVGHIWSLPCQITGFSLHVIQLCLLLSFWWQGPYMWLQRSKPLIVAQYCCSEVGTSIAAKMVKLVEEDWGRPIGICHDVTGWNACLVCCWGACCTPMGSLHILGELEKVVQHSGMLADHVTAYQLG